MFIDYCKYHSKKKSYDPKKIDQTSIYKIALVTHLVR